jgi:hypothetical protein
VLGGKGRERDRKEERRNEDEDEVGRRAVERIIGRSVII